MQKNLEIFLMDKGKRIMEGSFAAMEMVHKISYFCEFLCNNR